MHPQLDFSSAPVAPRQMADTSLDAYARILPTLKDHQWAALFGVYDVVESKVGSRQPNVTGGELAEFVGTLVTSIRPRLTELDDLGLIEKQATRPSAAKYEGACHP